MSNGGTILKVDLSQSLIEKARTPKPSHDLLAGALLGIKTFWDHVPPETKALEPENMLMFNLGPLTGTPFGNKADVASKSPEQPNSPYVHVGLGGQFPTELKFAGYDHLAILGKADHPVYLYIYNDRVEIKDANHLWGLNTQKTQAKVKEELKDPDVQIACIGPAGENQYVHALILHDIQNAASRGGLGAVMGSKNLKAIAVRGTKGVSVADPKSFVELWKTYYNHYANGRGYAYSKTHNQGGIARHIVDGYRYKLRSKSDNADTNMKTFLKKYMIHSLGCSFCPIQCQENYSVPGIGNGGAACAVHGGLFTGIDFNTGVPQVDSDFESYKSWWKATLKMQEYGMESLATQMIANWLMLLYGRGFITSEHTDGVPMEMGSEEALLTVIDKIAKQEGFGKLFKNGIVPVAREWVEGRGAMFLDWVTRSRNRPSFAMSALSHKGFGTTGKAAKYRTGDIEAHDFIFDIYANVEIYAELLGISQDEAKNMIDEWADKASEKWAKRKDLWRLDVYDVKQDVLTMESEDLTMICDITGHCEWPSERQAHFGCIGGFEELSEWITATTGTNYTPEALRKAAQKARTMIDAYNVLCDHTLKEQALVTKEDAKPPFHIPDKFTGDVSDLEKLEPIGQEYCKLRGYDPQTGIPTRETLARLGLKDIADKLDDEGVFG